MASSIETFEQAMKLDTAALRALLTGHRPEQRVWAMWALALRQHGVPDLIQRTAVEPDPGVRRTLAVILASHGETDLLVALARHDPAIAVRASAMQLVTRLAAGGQIDRSVVLEAAQGEPEIQAAILAAIDARAPEFLVAIAVQFVQRGAPELQVEAFEALVRTGTPVGLHRAIAWLGTASPPFAIEACRRWARAETPEVVVRVLASAPAELRAIALQALRGASWPVLEALIGDDRGLLLQAMTAGVQLPTELLAQLFLGDAGPGALAVLVKRLQGLPAAPPELVPRLPGLREHAQQRRSMLAAELRDGQRAVAAVPRRGLLDANTHEDVKAWLKRRAHLEEDYGRLARVEQEIGRLLGDRDYDDDDDDVE